MPNANYVRGAAFERMVQRRLELLGWQTWRTPGSKSPADVIALRPVPAEEKRIRSAVFADALLLQCKAGRTGHFSERDRTVFVAYARACGATACYADQVQGIGVRVVELESGRELG